MKAIVVESMNRLSVRDIPEPEPDEYQARVRVLAASLCNSTDAKILHGEFAGPLPTVLGHEAAGRVVEVGAKVRHYRVGDLVVRPQVGPMPRLGLGASFGSFVEIGLVTDDLARAEDEGRERPWHFQTRADADWDPMTLVQTITLKETLSFLRNLGVKKGNSVLIFGTGPVGVSFSLWSRYLGCDSVIVVGRRAEACQRALDFGKATHVINNREQSVPNAVKRIMSGSGVSYAIEAIGDNGVLRDCIDSLAPGGKIGLYGVAPGSQDRSPLRDDPRVSNARPIEAMVDEEVLGLVRQGKIPAREFVSQELGFTECARAFELLASHKAFKVGLKFT